MKAFLIFLAGLAVACGADLEPDLKVKFDMGFDAFIPLYMTKDEAIAKGYKLTPGPKIPLPELVLYCPSEKDDKTDKALCLYMDDETGHICGMNIALREDKLSEAQFDFSVQGWGKWVVQTEDGKTVSYMTKQLYYCSSEFLKKPVEERIACRKENKVLPEKAVWLTGYNNDLDRIPISEDELVPIGYTKQAFFPWMGQHFYYKMTPATQCRDNCMYPWFCLTHEAKLIGVGLMIFSKVDNPFFENPGKPAVKMIVPSGPECLYDMAKDGGVRTMHFYFIDGPRTLLWPS